MWTGRLQSSKRGDCLDRPSLFGFGTYAFADGYLAERSQAGQRGAEYLGCSKANAGLFGFFRCIQKPKNHNIEENQREAKALKDLHLIFFPH